MCPKGQGSWSWSWSGQRKGARLWERGSCTKGIKLRIIIFTGGGGGGGGNEERNGLSITIPVPVPITSQITSPITKDIAARSGAWPRSGLGPMSWPSKGTFFLQIDFPTVIIINYYCHCYIILTYVAFGTIMLSLQIKKSSRQNVTDFLHDFIKFY